MVITALTRNQVVLTGSWVRIPPLPPQSPVNSRIYWTFSFPCIVVLLVESTVILPHFEAIFMCPQEQRPPENPYISRLFGGALNPMQELRLPAGAFTVRKNKNIVHNIRGSDLRFVVQMTVNIRRRADITMTEPFLYLLHRNIVCKK